MMRTRRLGSDGPEIGVVGLGGNNFARAGSTTSDLAGTNKVIDAALASGLTFIDTAEAYGAEFGSSEDLLGQALEHRRDDFVIATKFGFPPKLHDRTPGAGNGSREYIRAAVEGSLRRLRTDRIDLYQQHRPDPETPIGETIAALNELVDEGKIRYFGHSTFSADQIREADDAARATGSARYVSAQDEYSLLNRAVEEERFPAVLERGLGFLPFYPLASGLLTGKYTRDAAPEGSRLALRPGGLDEAPWGVLESYAKLCDDRGVSMLTATMGWMLAQPAVTSVIAGATRPEQVAANVAAAEWIPTPADVEEISALFRP